MNAPAVSVLMPSYNYRRYLEEAIGSVMSQTCRDFELIIFDDGSHDGSLEYAREWQARFPGQIRVEIHEGHCNRGLLETYRAAMRLARGKVVAFLESDDVWEPENLEKKMKVLEKYPDVGVVCSRYRPFGWKRGVLYWRLYELANAAGNPMGRPADFFNVFLKRNPVASFSHFIVHRELLENIPALGTMRMNNDWWVLSHLSAKTKFYMVPEFLCRWRIHRSSLGFGRVDMKLLWKLRGFLVRLYRSLGKNPGGDRPVLRVRREKRLLKFLKLQQKLERRRWAALLKMMINPFACARFLCYVVLRNILFS